MSRRARLLQAGRRSGNPTRTCVGCRASAGWSRLLRVTVAQDEPGVLVPDPRHRLPGRGAWVHPDPDCLDLAVRRRAFVRALRLQRPADHTPVAEYLRMTITTSTTSTSPTVEIGSGSASDGYPMSSQQ